MIADLDACACGVRYSEFRCSMTFAEASASLRVGHEDPELWRNRSRSAVLRFLGDLKRNEWEAAHGYCADALAALRTNPACTCDHCNPELIAALAAA